MIPSLPNDNKDEDYNLMPNIKRVMDYSRLNYFEVLELPVDTYLMMLKCSVIDELNSSEEGRDYLEKCERLSKTDIDIDAFRRKMNETGK